MIYTSANDTHYIRKQKLNTDYFIQKIAMTNKNNEDEICVSGFDKYNDLTIFVVEKCDNIITERSKPLIIWSLTVSYRTVYIVFVSMIGIIIALVITVFSLL